MRKHLLSFRIITLFVTLFSLQKLAAQNTSPYWSLVGNSNASNTTSKLGTTNNVNLRLFTNNLERMRIDTLGRVGIGTLIPNASALIDLSSTQRGFLVPRLTTLQKNAITAPAQGLLIYQIDGTKGFYYYDAGWKPVTPVVSGFANRALSNLTVPTALNVDLLPGINNARNMGSSTRNWKDLYLEGSVWKDSSRFISSPGSQNTFLGIQSGRLVNGSANTGVGYFSLYNDTSGYLNTAVGSQSLYSNTSGVWNTAVGVNTLYSNTTGYSNTGLGTVALINNTTGTYNTAVGVAAMHNNTTGTNNNAQGVFALYSNTTGSDNIAQGYEALYSNTNGQFNTASGDYALYSNTTGYYNTAYGGEALSFNTTGYSNNAVGLNALRNNTTGIYNTANGYQALYAISTEAENTAVGFNAGYNPTSYSTFLGAEAFAGNSSIVNAMALGYGALVYNSNQVVVGNTTVTSIGGQVNWTAFSDGRYKKNIKENVPGLEFINQLRPVTYTLDIDGIDKVAEKNKPKENNEPKSITLPDPTADLKASTGVVSATPALTSLNTLQPLKTKQNNSPEIIAAKQAKAKIVYTGFVAQEVEQAAKKLNYDFSGVDKPQNSNGFYGLRYGDFVVPLVKAVQELSKENEELKKKNDDLEERLKRVEELVTKNNFTSNSYVDMNSASLDQNEPNPFNIATVIRYHLPPSAASAKVVITDLNGKMIKSISLTSRGNGAITLNSGTLAAGSYNYTLWVEGKQVDSKKMIIAK